MKIDYKNYPILEDLYKGNTANFHIRPEDKEAIDIIKLKLLSDWKKNRQGFMTETNVITIPFSEAVVKAADKLLELYENILTEDLSDLAIQGTYILKDIVVMINFHVWKGREDAEKSFYMFDRRGTLLAIDLFSSKDGNRMTKWASQSFPIKDQEELQTFIDVKVSQIVCMSMFKSYAEVETKILKPHQKPHDIACDYRNNTKLDVTFLDCKWFTNLVKSEGFNVRGHFRLQPKKKEGVWTKELIWINEFHKTGYTAKAKILSYKPMENEIL